MGPFFITFYPGYRFSLHYVNLYYINCNIKYLFVISTMYLLLSLSFPCLLSTEFCHKNSYNEYSLILLLMNPMQLQWVKQYNCCQLFIELITECFQQQHYINGHLIFMLIFSSHTLKYYSLHGFFSNSFSDLDTAHKAILCSSSHYDYLIRNYIFLKDFFYIQST